MSTVLDANAVEEAASTPAPPPPPGERLVALDVFRGLTIAGMLLVNDPGSWGAIYPPLAHAKWHGWTPTDLVFPFFLFIVGVTTHLSMQKRSAHEMVRKILRRGLLIVLVGLLLNAFPFYWWGKIDGNPDPTLGQRVLYRAQHLRFPGVLQRIGIVYMAAALLTLRTSRRQQIAIVAAILIGYFMVMTLVPVPGTGTIGALLLDQPDKTLEAWVDRAVIGTNHIWAQSKTWDPEGLLSTIPAVATAMLGIFVGRWLTEKRRPLMERIVGLYGIGCVAMLGGSLWGWVFPINKGLWTSSYVIFTAGFACVVLATCVWIIDVHQIHGWTKPFVIYGVNPLIAFAGSGVMARLIDSLLKIDLDGKAVSLHQASYQLWFEPYFPAKFASLLWGLCFVLLWLGVLTVLYRRKIIVKL
jgi:predicted acyltransferase